MAKLKTSPFLVGHRYLVKEKHSWSGPRHEVTILEHSPSLDYVKIGYASGDFMWLPQQDYEIVEELAKPKRRKRR